MLNPDKFKNANQQDIEEIHNFVMSKDSFRQAKLQQLLMSWGTYVKIREDDDMTSLSYNEKLQQYAELLVKIGMNVQPKQPVFIRSSVDAIDLTRLIVEESYKAGASDVKVNYSDSKLNRLKFEYESVNYFENHAVKSYEVDERMDYANRGAANLALLSGDPNLLNGIDPEKLKANQMSYSQAFKGYMEGSQRISFHGLLLLFLLKIGLDVFIQI